MKDNILVPYNNLSIEESEKKLNLEREGSMTLMEQVNEVFREVFDDPNMVVTEDMNATHVGGWDSFAQVNLIVSFEDKYNIQFTTQEISALTCVGDMLDLLREKGVK